MIIGNGDIANALKEGGIDNDEILYFASGVSNSSETNTGAYEREKDLFDGIYQHQGKNLHRVYFSSLSIYYSDSVYAHHKLAMEKRITWGKWSYTIIRLGNITWGNNQHTIINYFKSCYQKGIQPDLEDTYRYLVTKDEFIHWLKMIRIGQEDIMNITGEMVHVNEIWRRVQNGYY